MYLLDTHIVSELRKIRSGQADRHVAKWADGVETADLYLSVITIQELEIGVLLIERRDPSQWLNIKELAEKLLKPINRVVGVKYYTARVSGRIDPTAPARQQLYLDALHTVSEITVHMGSVLLSQKFAGLVNQKILNNASCWYVMDFLFS